MLDFGVLNGIGSAMIFTPSFAILGHYFDARRGLVAGIASTGGSIGGILIPIFLQRLIPKIGFGWAVRTLGFAMLGLAAIAITLIKARPPPLPMSSSSVESQSSQCLPKTAWEVSMPKLHILGQPAFGLFTIAAVLIEIALFVPLTYLVSHAVRAGIDEHCSYLLLIIVNGASIPGRIMGGLLADRIGRFNALFVFVLTCAVATGGIWLPAGKSFSQLACFSAVFGFASGSNLGLTPVCIGQLCGTNELGRYHATCYMMVSVG